MLNYIKWIPLVGVLTACGMNKKTKDITDNKMNVFEYPNTFQSDSVLNYFGEFVSDPYQWLENDRSKETEEWVAIQNKLTFSYLNTIPYRSQIANRMKSLWNYEKISAPFKKGQYEYFYKNNGLQNQSIVYRKGKNGKEEVFLDPNTFSTDGTTSLDVLSFSQDGSLCAYSISEGGSDWRKIFVIDSESKEKLTDRIIDAKFTGISWLKNEGFYYSAYDKPTGSELSAKTDQHKLYYHKLNTLQEEDVVVFGDKDKVRYVSGYMSDNQNILFISTANATSGNALYFQRIGQSKIEEIDVSMKADFSVVDSNEEGVFLLTNFEAPNKKLIYTNLNQTSDKSKWITIIKEEKEVLNVSTGGGYFFAHYLKDAVSEVKQFSKSGSLEREIVLPGIGTASGFSTTEKDTIIYFSFTNYYTPSSIYSLNINNGEVKSYIKPNVDFDTEKYESKQVFYKSKDGTLVPMILTYKKGLDLNGQNPTMLYGYGGFNISLSPTFSVSNAVWMEMGGVYAVANLRGGGEYGKSWHKAGTQMQKQNVFDDFIAAANYLIDEKYTTPDYLAISGRSNGGLLVGAVMTQQPNLFKVAFPGVGVLDMLKYHTFTAGAGWGYDYGTAIDSPEMFHYLKSYSPVHNVKDGVNYPATMVTTGDHDDRVVPSHSYKFAAELQKKNVGENPMLIRIDVNAGHGAGKSVAMTIQEYADMYAFALYNMKIKTVSTSM